MSEASALLRALSEPWSSGERVKSALGRAADLAGLNYWRAFDIWYEKARRIEYTEMMKIKDALALKNRMEAQNEFAQLRHRLAVLEKGSLLRGDTDMDRPLPDAVGKPLRRSR